MSNLKRILYLLVALLLIGGYGVAFFFALSDSENGGAIAVNIFAFTTIFSVFIAVLFRIKKYADDKAKSQKDQ